MRAGQLAYAAGMPRRAHEVWRQAAALCPGEEQVWLALLNVLEDENDRRVCLQNIVMINPNNRQARSQLDRYLQTLAEDTQPAARVVLPPAVRPPVWWQVVTLLLRGALNLLLALALLVLLQFLLASIGF